MPTKEDFIRALRSEFDRAERNGLSKIDITSGELHRRVGGYPGTHHRMPVCCDAMQALKRATDTIVDQPPKGKGATLTIRYHLPR